MSPFRPSRAPRQPDQHLHIKMLLFVFGAGFLLAGIASGRDWLVGIAVAVFAAGVLLRLIGERRQRLAEDESWTDEDPEAEER
jgi:hypothetical protein